LKLHGISKNIRSCEGNMIKQLSNFVTNEQIEIIANRIREQFYKYRKLMNTTSIQELFPDEYAPHKKAHSFSWAVTGAFRSGTDIAGFHVHLLKYGRGHRRPELKNENIIFHILSNSTNFQAKYLKPYYKMNENRLSNQQVYGYFLFNIENDWLDSLELCVPDTNGTVFASEILFKIPHIVKEVV